jgi:hypothetical protein
MIHLTVDSVGFPFLPTEFDMAMQVAQSGLARKYGGRLDQAVKAHANDETEYGFQQLPAGIRNGVAKLTKCYFDQYKTGDNKGEYYLRCEGVVVAPIMHRLPDGSEIRVAGGTTSIMRPACETKYGGKVITFEENIADVMNEFRKLGADTSSAVDGASLETIASALASTAQSDHPIYFKFETTARVAQKDVPEKNIKKGDILPGIFENWYGSKGLEDYKPTDIVASHTNDNSGGSVSVSSPSVEMNGHTTTQTPAVESTTDEVPSAEYTDQGSTNAADIDALVEKAENSDTDAQNELNNLAQKLEVFDQTKDLATWAEAGEVIKAALSHSPSEPEPEAEPEPVEEPEDKTPAVGNTYKYKPMMKGPGNKMVQSKKAVDVEVLKVYPKNRTADLKNLVDGKPIKGVSWDSLE